MKKILISACLLGQNVRYDGANKLLQNDIIQRWIDQARLIPFCPEVAGGLPVPRRAAEIKQGDGYSVLQGKAEVMNNSGKNVTAEFICGAQQTLAICHKYSIKMAILTARSPSCANREIYDGSFLGNTISGSGVTAALLTQHGIRVYNQHELVDAEYFMKVEDI